jgi:hypothetical protein
MMRNVKVKGASKEKSGQKLKTMSFIGGSLEVKTII